MCPIGKEGSRVRKEGSQVRGGSRVRQEITEEGQRAHRPKRYTDNNEDEDNSPNNADNSARFVYFLFVFPCHHTLPTNPVYYISDLIPPVMLIPYNTLGL